MKIGRRVYYDSLAGDVIILTNEYDYGFTRRSIEQDVETYRALTERNRDSFDVIELEYGQYAQDFAECISYRVNPDTLELEFNYPDPNEPEVEQPYQAPLSETINTNTEYLIDVDFRLSMFELGL